MRDRAESRAVDCIVTSVASGAESKGNVDKANPVHRLITNNHKHIKRFVLFAFIVYMIAARKEISTILYKRPERLEGHALAGDMYHARCCRSQHGTQEVVHT
jgi:hypothetical protein